MLKNALMLTLGYISLSACVHQPANEQGKAFDANSSYCRTTWQNAQDQYAHGGTKVINKNTQLETTVFDQQTTDIKRWENKVAYEKDCESKAAYTKRKEKEKVKFPAQS